MAIIRNELINNGKPYAVQMKGSKRRKYQYKDVEQEKNLKKEDD